MKRCKHCGARSLAPRRVCDYCGTPYVQGFGFPGRQVERREMDGFERLLAHPDFQTLLEGGPGVSIPKRRKDGPSQGVALLLVFVCILKLTGGLEALGSFHWVALFAVLGATGSSILRRHSRQQAFPGTHLESLPARLVEVLGRRGSTMSVTLELPSGERRMLNFGGGPGETWIAGDFGVAHIKANVLVEFRPIR